MDKKNTDYSHSAVDLNNNPITLEAFRNYQQTAELSESLRVELENTEQFKLWTKSCDAMAQAKLNVIESINKYGSYQDVELGSYAVKQRKLSRQYHAEPFMEHFEKYAPAVIEQAINVKALDGLIKGKLIDETTLVDTGVITTTESYSYIVK